MKQSELLSFFIKEGGGLAYGPSCQKHKIIQRGCPKNKS